MRTAITLLVITSILLCGFVAAAQQEAAPGIETAPAVEGQPGAETVEGAPGAPTDSSAEAAPGAETGRKQYKEGDRLPDGTLVGTPRGERPVKQEDLDQGDGNVNPPNPPAQPTSQVVERVVERRTVVVRQLAAATQRGDQVAVKRLTTELGEINERIAAVEANPLGGTEGQRSMWGLLHDAGVVSESHLRTRYGLVPVSAPESQTESIMPATPAKGRGSMPIALQIVLGAIAVGAAVMAIIALAGVTRRFFLRDPNREPADSAPAPQSVGRRDIVTETARGDYSRETVVAADVAAAEALASAERVAAVMEVFAARAAARRGEATSAPVAPSAVTVNASSDAGAVAAAAPAPQEIVIRVVGGEPPVTHKKEEPPKKAAPKATPKKEAPKEEAK